MGVKVKERRPGEWWLYISHNGKRKAKKIGRDRRSAEDLAKKIEARLVLGAFDMAPAKKHTPTLSEVIDGWNHGDSADPGWAYSAELRLKRSTLSSYKKNIRNHVKPHLGNHPIDSVTPKDISDLIVAVLKSGKRSQTVKNIKNCLSSIFEKAKTDGLVPSNTAAACSSLYPRIRNPSGNRIRFPGRTATNSRTPSIAISRFIIRWSFADSGPVCESAS